MVKFSLFKTKLAHATKFTIYPMGSKIAYKTYLNERLKKVLFHDRETHPLYIQVTFNRKTIFFKSSFFELFSNPRYELRVAGKRGAPSMEDVVQAENQLMDFIIDKTKEDFSLSRFKKAYSYYCKDLCDLTEPGFIEYLFTFFHDKGTPAFAHALKEGCRSKIAYRVLQDMKIILDNKLWEELLDHALHYAPPYLPLYAFMMQNKKWPFITFLVMEWENEDVRQGLEDHVKSQFNIEPSFVTGQVESLLLTYKDQLDTPGK